MKVDNRHIESLKASKNVQVNSDMSREDAIFISSESKLASSILNSVLQYNNNTITKNQLKSAIETSMKNCSVECMSKTIGQNIIDEL